MNALLVGLLLSAGPVKLALMPLDAGEGVAEKTAAALTETVVAELRHRPELGVITPSEMQAVLSIERQKQLLGCSDESCAADLGNVLGADRMVLGSVSNLGQSWLLHLKLVDVRKVQVLAQADRRLKDKTIDDVLDALPAAVAELFGGPAAAVVPAVAVATPDEQPTFSSSGGADEPYEIAPDVKKQLAAYSDGKGNYLALVPFGDSDSPFFAGDGKRMYLQRVVGSSSDGNKSFSLNIWDPRARDGWQKAFELKEDGAYMQCGNKQIPYKPVAAKDAKKLLSDAALMKARWRYAAHTLARDDGGNYFLLDQLRDVEDPSEGLRFFFGPKGGVRQLEIKSALADAGGMLVITPTGRLKISPAQRQAEWITTAGSMKLTLVEIGPQEAKLIYSTLGAYKGEKLGTACDPHL